MDAQRMLRRLLPLIVLAALGALLARQRRKREALPVVLPLEPAAPQLLLPPVQAALVGAEEAVAADVTVVATAAKVVVPELAEVKIAATPAPAGRFERAPVDIVTVVDDLLGSAG